MQDVFSASVIFKLSFSMNLFCNIVYTTLGYIVIYKGQNTSQSNSQFTRVITNLVVTNLLGN